MGEAAAAHPTERHSAPPAFGHDAGQLLTFRPARHSLGTGLGAGGLAQRSGRPSSGLRSGVSSVLLVSTAEDARQLGSLRSQPRAEGPGEGAEELQSSRVQPWPSTSALIVAEVVGTGILALGGQTATMGLPIGLLVLLLCYPLNLFTALLLSRVHRALPGVVTFGDALDRLLGGGFAVYGYVVLYVYLFFNMTNYMIVLSDSLQNVAYRTRLCRPAASAIGAVLLLPANQFRSLSGLAALSAFSFATVIATIGICLWKLLGDDPHCPGAGAQTGFIQYSSALSGFVFSFAGQSIMLEMQAEMKEPAHFPRAACAAFTTLFLAYCAVAALSYHACGSNTPGELLQVLPNDSSKAVAGMLMVAHLIVTYTINQQVFSRAVCVFLLPGALGAGTLARVKWFAVTTISMAACYLVANCVPLFQDIVNLTGALLSTQVAFIIPGVLILALQRKQPAQTAALGYGLSVGSCCVVGIGVCLAVTGTISSAKVIADSLSSGGNAPFSCHALGA